ncbi:MAG: TonB-dependent receptor [Burkholderiaceae bacterium]|jgi:outer membrane receptor protein involved in Fe transport|nr:TonB-dependent receptor [Burkholderiaceae bacterium]
MPIGKKWALAIALACSWWHLVQAQEATLAPIEVTGHYDNALGSSDAASQGSAGASLIANRPTLRTGEILEFVPGLIVTQHSGDGKANQYYLRGFNLDHGTDFATYVDGMPVNMRGHAHGQGYTDLNFVIPELIQRIDYKKGPYFADEGDFASAGAAHLRLFNTLDKGIASLSLGEHGYGRAVLAGSTAAGAGHLLYGLELTRNNGPWQVPQRERKYSGLLRYSAGTPTDGYAITAMAYGNRWNATDQIPLRAVESGLIGRYGTLAPSDGGDTSRYSLSLAMNRRNSRGMFRFNAYAVQSDLKLSSDFTYFLNDPVHGDQFQQSEKRRMIGFDASQSWSGTLGGMDMQNRLGVQGRYDALSPVGLYSSIERSRTDVISESQVRQGSLGLYVENIIQWTEKFRSVAGIRYDAYHFKVGSSVAGNSGRANDHIVSPKLSLIFGPWAKTEYFINYGSGFHSNDARGTTQTRLPSGDPADPVTPLVRTKGAEIGLRTEIVPGLQSSVALWWLDIDSELVFVGDAGETTPSRASRRHGIEWNNHYAVGKWLLIDLDLAVSRAHFTGAEPAGNRIPGAIEKVASFGVALNDLGPWSAAFQLRYFGPRPLIEDGSARSRSTTLASARVGYRIDKNTRLTLDVFNLFNRKASDIDYYYPSRLPGEPAGGVDDIHFHPVEPRTFRLRLSHHF